MKILFVSPEVAPFAKVGGLGDVGAALPRQLHALGHDVRVFLPFYPRVLEHAPDPEVVLPRLSFTVGPRTVQCSLLATELPGTSCPVYLVKCPGLFEREAIYSNDPDEHLRFSAFAWAALLGSKALDFAPDIVHVNDWTTGLIPLMLKVGFSKDAHLGTARSVLTIHNLGHQGTFPASVLPETGLAQARHLFHEDQLKEGRLSYLLTGLMYAHAITTVSPTYAREIQTPEQGFGLDWALRARRDVLVGILNGIDEEEWDPRTDTHLTHHFDADTLETKEENKKELLAGAGMPYRPEVPVIAMCSRLVYQKGIDLCMEALPSLLRQHRFQLVVLGKGEPKYEGFFRELQKAHRGQVEFDPTFSERKAHVVEAGADMLLMPSMFEPCGLNQMYSLRYGTVPIVHRTGGLADTVWNYDDVAAPQGTGFLFDHHDASGLTWAVKRALKVWGTGQGDDRERWRQIQRNGMKLPFGWRHRVGRYVELYEQVAAR
ncbi:MAG: glycogen synthase GlgA [Myxococcota bacterium]